MVARSIAFLCLAAGAAAAIAPLSITGPPVPGRMHVIAGSTGPIAASGAAAPGGYNQTYGYPDGIGGLIVENPFAGSNFPIWSDQNRWGAVGMIIAPGTFGDDKKCSAVPAASPFAGRQPVKTTNGAKFCLIGCNTTLVKQTGTDPCRVASLEAPLSHSPMSCFDLGPGTVSGAGACGYNCSLISQTKGTPCSQKDRDDSSAGCLVYCDSRTFPVVPGN